MKWKFWQGRRKLKQSEPWVPSAPWSEHAEPVTPAPEPAPVPEVPVTPAPVPVTPVPVPVTPVPVPQPPVVIEPVPPVIEAKGDPEPLQPEGQYCNFLGRSGNKMGRCNREPGHKQKHRYT